MAAATTAVLHITHKRTLHTNAHSWAVATAGHLPLSHWGQSHPTHDSCITRPPGPQAKTTQRHFCRQLRQQASCFCTTEGDQRLLHNSCSSRPSHAQQYSHGQQRQQASCSCNTRGDHALASSSFGSAKCLQASAEGSSFIDNRGGTLSRGPRAATFWAAAYSCLRAHTTAAAGPHAQNTKHHSCGQL